MNNKLDLVWFGGFTFVQANVLSVRSGCKMSPIVQREEDQKFCSVFTTTDRSINPLADLKGKNFAFGAESSTSGHLVPRSYLLAVKINPNVALERIAFSCAYAGYRGSGSRRTEYFGLGKNW